MLLLWAEQAWQDYLYWQNMDAKTVKCINALIKDITCSPYEGVGNPEPLKYNWTGYWSRRIDREHRQYRHERDTVMIAQCRYHY
ncbi:Txe/YoeB family addiction module toxin [Flavobacterium coralii]|uniref:Txe/YoeB family addiction module toxin n=1 Tax=Flavobacterium coralii TaxID=2838017 RepID=UPI000C468858|nr:Txe/YoeB family addiction module toxin [Flavobacterium sp.]|tara:strand:- start:884 stop:1135 length:252 start_codon:yes stop_codon:yes gene_type:complete